MYPHIFSFPSELLKVSIPVFMAALAPRLTVIDSRLYIFKSDNISENGAFSRGTRLLRHLFVHRQCTYSEATRSVTEYKIQIRKQTKL